MAERLVKLWIRSDDDPSGIDWQAWLPKGITVEHAEVSSFPSADVEHVITWWITRPLSREEWRDLVDAEGDVLARIVGESQFQGMAGPIPMELEDDYRPDSALEGHEDPSDEES